MLPNILETDIMVTTYRLFTYLRTVLYFLLLIAGIAVFITLITVFTKEPKK